MSGLMRKPSVKLLLKKDAAKAPLIMMPQQQQMPDLQFQFSYHAQPKTWWKLQDGLGGDHVHASSIGRKGLAGSAAVARLSSAADQRL